MIRAAHQHGPHRENPLSDFSLSKAIERTYLSKEPLWLRQLFKSPPRPPEILRQRPRAVLPFIRSPATSARKSEV